jgi:hypothetical protein
MNIPALTAYLTEQLDALSKEGSAYCTFSYGIKTYQETSCILQACGHDTTELDTAITAVQLAAKTLKDARDSMLGKFNSEGVRGVVATETLTDPVRPGRSPEETEQQAVPRARGDLQGPVSG